MQFLPERKVIRRKGYDYTSEGAYFITICTKNREQYFGKIKNGEIILNELGKCTLKCWNEIPEHFEFIEIDEFICMPDHIHGILMIKSLSKPKSGIIVGTDYHPSDRQIQKTPSDGQIQKTGSLGSIIRGFKIGVMKFAKQHNIPFARQSRFYDHIISDEKEFQKIKIYIQNNPKNRENDNIL